MADLRHPIQRAAFWRERRGDHAGLRDGDFERRRVAKPSGVSWPDRLEESGQILSTCGDRAARPAVSQQLRFLPQYLGAPGDIGERAVTIKNSNYK